MTALLTRPTRATPGGAESGDHTLIHEVVQWRPIAPSPVLYGAFQSSLFMAPGEMSESFLELMLHRGDWLMADMTNHMSSSHWVDNLSVDIFDCIHDDDAIRYMNSYHPNMHDDFIHCAVSYSLSFAISGRPNMAALLLSQDWYQVPDE